MNYDNKVEKVVGLKEGILLEIGFDTVAPNTSLKITSWAFDKATTKAIEVLDNRAMEITCYHPGYTFVEKLQTIATKFRREQAERQELQNFMRHYYDVYCLLNNEDVQKFIGTAEYHNHKEIRFPRADFDIPISNNEAFLLSSEELRDSFNKRYKKTSTLYYKGQPSFDDVLSRIKEHIDKL